jgi:hypothetical protein
MYSNLFRVSQSVLFGIPLIRQVLYLLFTFTYIYFGPPRLVLSESCSLKLLVLPLQ